MSLMQRSIVAALPVLLLAAPAGDAKGQTLPTWGRPASPEQVRRLDAKIKSLERTTGLQAATIAAVAERLGLEYPNLTEVELFQRLDAQILEAVKLRSQIRELRTTIDRLRVDAIGLPAIRLLDNAEAAFEDGDFEKAELLFGRLSRLRFGQSVDGWQTYLAAVRSQAHAAELQGGAADFYRANMLLSAAQENATDRISRLLSDRLELSWEKAGRSSREAELFGRFGGFDSTISTIRNELVSQIDRSRNPSGWAAAQNSLGNALTSQGQRTVGVEGVKQLEAAEVAFREALLVFENSGYPFDKAMVQNNLGSALLGQAERLHGPARHSALDKALTAYRSALKVYSKDGFPESWAMVQNNLAIALQTKGMDTEGDVGLALLLEAQARYQMALEIRTRDTLPLEWANTLANMANAKSAYAARLPGNDGKVVFREAVKKYRLVLSVIDKADQPVRWAEVKHSLGVALKSEGERTEDNSGLTLLEASLRELREALSAQSQVSLPLHWSKTQASLGDTLLAYAWRLEPRPAIVKLEEAIWAYKSALRHHKMTDSPLEWAALQEGLGKAYLGRAGATEHNRCENIELARSAFRDSWRVFDQVEAPRGSTRVSSYFPVLDEISAEACGSVDTSQHGN